MKKFLMMSAVAVALVGCASSGNQSLKNETAETVASKITKGKTTKDQVRTAFGDPFETSFTDNGSVIWKYQLKKETADAVNYIPVVSAFHQSYSGTKKELIIMFDDNDRVKSYSMSSSNTKTKAGLGA